MTPSRGTLNTLALFHGRSMTRYRLQRDRIIAGRLRDAWCWATGFLSGVIAVGALAVAVVSFKVMG